jgi:ATP-binding cassette, subfamily B, bacterial
MRGGTTALKLSWPISRLGEAVELLARNSGLAVNSKEVLSVPESLLNTGTSELSRWMNWAVEKLGLEAEAIATPARDLAALLQRAAPAVLRIQGAFGPEFFLLLKCRGRSVHLVGPDSVVRSYPITMLRDMLCGPDEARFSPEIDRVLASARITSNKRQRVHAALMRERLGNQEIGQCWLLRPSPRASFWSQLKSGRLPQQVLWMLFAFSLGYALEIASWTLMGQTTLNGQLDTGWLIGWGLLMLSLIPVRLLAGWLDASFAAEFARLLKARLLMGSLCMDIEQTKHLGIGQLLSRVMDSQSLESLAVNGGMTVLVSILELAFAASIMVLGAGGSLHLILLAGWLALTLGMSWKYTRRMREWTLMRLDMTHDMIERMVGHRTRLVQERAERRAVLEDQTIQEYLAASKAMDHSILPVAGLMARGWMLVGLLGLAPSLISGSGNLFSIAIGFGGVMLANRALIGISGGVASLSSAALAWVNVATLFRSADKKVASSPFVPTLAPATPATPAALTVGPSVAAKRGSKLIDASQLVFRYQDQGAAVIRGADLSIHHGERILLQGGSGGGKSTLASLLVGLRQPESGLLLLNGLDRHTLGDSWHQLATEAPQFHENHILSGSLAFNLLMGRNWPASDQDLVEAEEICLELGLGELIQKMPSGLMQRVGETGWQLSHGERSRIFLARALLQNAQLTVLDESFAALDPQTLERCLSCALKRSQTLLVIAHP